MSPAHTVNWDLVSDMVNAVSRVYRGPRQCKQRFDNIIAPREEGRILYDMPASGKLFSSNFSKNSLLSSFPNLLLHKCTSLQFGNDLHNGFPGF